MNRSPRLFLLCLFLFVCAFDVPARAQLIAYEGFNYTPGTALTGLNGGTGWNGGWTTNTGSTPATVQSGSISYGALPTTGNSVLSPSNTLSGNGRDVTTTLGADGTTLYVSFLITPLSPINQGPYGGYGQINFGNFSIGKQGTITDYGMNHLGGGGFVDSGVPAVQGQTVFLVARVQFLSGPDIVDLWVNPPLGQPLPATPNCTKSDQDLGQFTNINFGSDNTFAFDEIRFGLTYADVAPAPPSYYLLWQNVQTGDTAQWLMSGPMRVSGNEMIQGLSTVWKIVGSGNFSGSAIPDILWQNTQTGEVGYWQMNGTQIVLYTQIAPPGFAPTAWQIVGAGNLSGSGGVSNILWQNEQTGEIGYWTLANGNYSSYIQLMAAGKVSTSWQIEGVPDFTGTGKNNILFQNRTTGEIGYWTLSGGKYSNYTQIEKPGVVATAWRIAATPDVNGDDQSDIIFQNEQTGEIGYWQMRNGQYQSYTRISAPGYVSTLWQLRGAF